MVAQTTTKPVVKTTIRISNLRAGDYAVLSSDGSAWYAVNVVRLTCTCKAGQNGFRSCKRTGTCRHLAAARMLAKCCHDRAIAARQPRPMPATGAAGLMEGYA